MSILIRTGTIKAKASARCAVCGGTGVHVGATTFGGEPEFYHYSCMVKRADGNLTELVWSSNGDGPCTARRSDGD